MIAMMSYKLVRSLRAWLRARVVQDLHLNLIIGSTNDLTAQLYCAITQTVLISIGRPSLVAQIL